MNDENDQNGAALSEASETPADEGSAPVTSDDVKISEPQIPTQWQMPEPVFRKSSGYLPQGFEQRYPAVPTVPDNSARADAATGPADEGLAVAGQAIQPQPDISQEFVVDEFVTEAPPVKERSRFMAVLLSVLGIVAMIVFAVGFLVLIYYLFFYHPNESQNLN